MKIFSATPEAIARAAEIIRSGGLVIMPTETVYGLAADAMNDEAVSRVFAAKQRPPENPLIVHLADASQVLRVAEAFPERAQQLAARFWPGPLTLVLNKRAEVSELVTGGLQTVAVRVPAHPVAQQLLVASGTPLAAPSANTFMKLSPTRAEDIEAELLDRVDMVLDGGACAIGLESTVVDCTTPTLQVLRPGAVPRSAIEDSLSSPTSSHRSPGQYARHYAPVTPLVLVERLGPDESGLTFETATHDAQIQMPASPVEYGARLYAALNELDRLGLKRIAVQRPPESAAWEAVWDRLVKASHGS